MAKLKKKKSKSGFVIAPHLDKNKRREDLAMYLKAFNKAIKMVMKDDDLLMKVQFSMNCFRYSRESSFICINKIEFEDVKPLDIKPCQA